MPRSRAHAALLALVSVLVLAFAGLAVAATHKKINKKPQVVHVIDDAYTCGQCKHSGTSNAQLTVHLSRPYVKWVWASGNQNTHDVQNRNGRPRKTKAFHSELAASDYSYSHRFVTAGTYRVFCSIHDTMRLRVVVKR